MVKAVATIRTGFPGTSERGSHATRFCISGGEGTDRRDPGDPGDQGGDHGGDRHAGGLASEDLVSEIASTCFRLVLTYGSTMPYCGLALVSYAPPW